MPGQPAPGAAARPRIRRPAYWVLALVVVVTHLLVSNRLAENRVGWGAGEAPPPRIEVAFVRELAAAAPPPVAAPVAKADRRLPAVAAKAQAAPAASATGAATAASASSAGEPPPPVAAAEPVLVAEPASAPPPPSPVAVATELTPATTQPVPEPAPALAVAPALAATGAAAPPAPSASAVAFEWPPSTRLTYKLSGNYRGPVEGTAHVDWLRQGQRYQVHLETSVGPVLSRHITSEGELTPQGLAPRRFDGEQKVMFRSPRRWQLRFGPDDVVLSDGKTVPAQTGAQDEASQFVQLTWLFTTQPDRLRVGSAVEMPLAISKKLERWIYDVRGEETLRFSFGDVPTFHLKPRREAAAGDLTPEIWIAPSLQYLPVRIVIRDGNANWIDLTLDRPPVQAAQR